MLVLPHLHRWSASTALLLYNTAKALLDSAFRPLRYHPSHSHTPNHPPIHPPTYPPTHPYQVVESFGSIFQEEQSAFGKVMADAAGSS